MAVQFFFVRLHKAWVQLKQIADKFKVPHSWQTLQGSSVMLTADLRSNVRLAQDSHVTAVQICRTVARQRHRTLQVLVHAICFSAFL